MADVYIAKSVTDLTGLFSDLADVIFADGSQQITAGLNQSALTEGLSSLYGGPGFSGRIGGGSYGPLRVDVDGDAPEMIHWDSPGYLALYPGGDESLVKKIVISRGGTVDVMTGGTVTDFEVKKGYGFASGDVIVTNVRVDGGTYRQFYHATANTAVWIGSGNFTSERSFSGIAAIGHGVEAVWRRQDASATVPTGGTWWVNGTVRWFGGNAGTVNLMHPKACFDMSGVYADCTVTYNGFAEAVARSRFEAVNKGVTITPTVGTVFCGDPDSIQMQTT